MSRPLAYHRHAGRGELRTDSIYPLSVFLKRLGIGRHSLTALRRRGLPVHKIGRRLFVDGQQGVTFLRGLWEADQHD